MSRLPRIASAALLASLALSAFASPAQALETRPAPITFGSAEQPTFTEVSGLAVDQSDGDLYVLDASGANEVQEVTVSATEGKFKLKFGGKTSANIAFNASASTVKEALWNLETIGHPVGTGAENVSVSGGPGDAGGTHPYVITFTQELGKQDVAQLECVNGTTPLSGGSGCSVTTTVTGSSDDKLKRYHADGTPAPFPALGTNVIDGKGSGDATPQNRLFFPVQPFRSSSLVQVAVDESGGPTDGDIYLTQIYSHLVDVFAPSGAYLGQLTEFKEGPNAEGPKTKPFGEVCGLAVDPSGALYVSEYNIAVGAAFLGGIHKFTQPAIPHAPLANADNSANFSLLACQLAMGAGPTAGSIFDGRRIEDTKKLDVGTGALDYGVETGPNRTVAVDRVNGRLFTAPNESVKEYDASGPFEAVLRNTTTTPSRIFGLAAYNTGAGDELYVARSGSSHVEVYGPLETTPSPHAVTGEASQVERTTATLNGTVDPEGGALSGCVFEYGTTTSYGGTASCAESVGEIGSGASPVPVHAEISGLEAGKAYHFRLAASNGSGTGHGEDKSFSTPSATAIVVATAGTGAGTVKCEVGGGPEECQAEYAEGTELTLIATASPGSTFAGFSAGTGSAASCTTSPCSFTIEANSTLTATFNIAIKPKFKLTVSKTGSGSGTVTSTPAGINCGTGAGCEAEFDEGTEVTLSPAASSGSQFTEWTGACTGSGACKVTMSAAKAVGAKFDLIPRTLTITKAGTGTGEVKCKANGGSAEPCAASYPNGTALELIATANPGSSFAGFSSGTGSAASCTTSPCSFTIEANSTLTATFNIAIKPKFKLTVSKTGTGSGTVISSPAGINCGTGAGCEAEFDEGTEVTLSPAASSGSQFTEWTGACTGSGACKVTMSAAKAVGAKFDLIPRTLTITKAGTGTGEVKCKANGGSAEPCAASYPNGTALELIATANPGSSFAGFSSGTGSAASCTTSPCSFTIEANSTLTATFNIAIKPKFKLTVSKTGSGSGTVTSTPAGINCGTGAGCEAEFDEGTEVTLSPAASSGSQFTEWTGACTGSGACKVTMSAAKAVGAKFDLIPRTLTITKAGTGTGEVKCKANGGSAEPCAASYPNGTALELIATANPGSSFAGFSSGTGSAASCTTSPCSFTIEANSTLTATFNIAIKPKFKLTVSKTGSGSGTVISSPAGINCGTGAGCEAEFDEGTEVTLSPAASSGSQFTEWTGACTGSGACKVTMSAAKAVGAKFDLIPRTLTITKAGTGTGEVKCKANGGSAEPCAASYPNGTALELIATANPGSSFAGFSSGTGSAASCTTSPCSFTIEANSTLTATFNIAIKPKFKLTVSKTGSGSGTVISSPAGINCGTGAGCEAEFDEGTEVTLSPAPASGSEFKEWSGACSGSGACKVTMSAAKSVGAKFNLIPKPKFKLSVTKTGGGTGTITSTPAGITCGSGTGCEHEYEEGTHVTLTESPGAGSEFAGWQTLQCDESTASTCEITIGSHDEAVGASFVPKAKPKFKLSVSKSGTGSGTVTSSPSGINCGSGAGCEAEYEEGKEVTLSQSAASGSEFKEWTGACSGSGACKVTMSAAKSVGAKFDLKPHLPEFTLAIELSGNGSGLIACNEGACAERYPEGTEVTLSATALPGSVFAGWSGEGCSGTGTCKVTIEADTTISAKFLAIPSFPPPPPIQKGTALAAALASYQGDSALIRLLCPQGARCTGTLELFARLQSPTFAHRRHGPAKATLIGTASFDLAPQSQGSVSVKITSARARGILAAGRDLNAQLLGTSVHSRIVRLVAPPRGRHRG